MTAYRRIEQVPQFKYGLIMADNPWKFVVRSQKGAERTPDAHYSTMTIDQVKKLPVGSLAAPECWLWLWVPGCFVNIGAEVMEAWGFTFVTSGFWFKNQIKAPTKGRMGLGYVLRECGEPYMIGRIGKPKVIDRGIPSAFAEHKRAHSQKPEQAYQHCERMVAADTPKLDLFSRQERPNWDCMGDEYDKFEVS